MTFAHPYAFFMLIAVPPLVYLYISRLKDPATFTLSTMGAFKEMRSDWRSRLHHLPFVLLMLSYIAGVVAMARPQTTSSNAEQSTEGINITMVLDISTSMLARDLKPNRIEAAKIVASDFIVSRPHDNIGLVIFAGESYTQCPMTTDHSVLLNLLNSVEMGLIQDGTAIGNGLATAVSRLKETEGNSKVVILLTDGTNNAGVISPATAAEIARSFGIRVYTIGVGTRGEALSPVNTIFGIEYQPKKVDIDEDMLKSIAATTGGSYFRATDNESLSAIYKEIDKMEKVKLKVENFTQKTEYFYLFVGLALLLAFLAVLLRDTLFRTLP